jgi:hypothetical protein
LIEDVSKSGVSKPGPGGKRPGAGRKKLHPEAHGKPTKHEASEIIDAIGKRLPDHRPRCKCWKCQWKRDGERRDAIGFNARKYLWDREGGRPVDTVNHLHDKEPLNVNLTVTHFEVVEKARKRAIQP